MSFTLFWTDLSAAGLIPRTAFKIRRLCRMPAAGTVGSGIAEAARLGDENYFSVIMWAGTNYYWLQQVQSIAGGWRNLWHRHYPQRRFPYRQPRSTTVCHLQTGSVNAMIVAPGNEIIWYNQNNIIASSWAAVYQSFLRHLREYLRPRPLDLYDIRVKRYLGVLWFNLFLSVTLGAYTRA